MSCNRFQKFFEIGIFEKKLFYLPTGLYEKEKGRTHYYGLYRGSRLM
jgi:hypothetical protein